MSIRPPSCFTQIVRQAGQRRLRDAVFDDPQAAGALGDEQGAVRQEQGVPRVLEPLDDGLDLERLLLAA